MKQPVELPVGSMVAGDSFFVPCIDEDQIKRELDKLATAFQFDLRVEKTVYNGMFGLRVWRI